MRRPVESPVAVTLSTLVLLSRVIHAAVRGENFSGYLVDIDSVGEAERHTRCRPSRLAPSSRRRQARSTRMSPLYASAMSRLPELWWNRRPSGRPHLLSVRFAGRANPGRAVHALALYPGPYA